MEIENKRDQNEFNNALGYILRLDKIFYLIAESKVRENTQEYINSLRLLFHELVGEMNKEEVNTFKTKIRALTEELKHLKNNRSLNPQQVFYELEDLEIELRGVYKGSGLQNKTKDDFMSGTHF